MNPKAKILPAAKIKRVKIMKKIIILPAFNEAEGIVNYVKDLRMAVPEADILCINDGSTDNTAAVLRHGNISFVTHFFNMGIGATVRTGIAYALEEGYDVLVRVDGDGQHPASEIRKLLPFMESGEYDMVVGSRYGGETEFKSGFFRRMGSWFFRLFFQILVTDKVTDPTSGFFVINRSVMEMFNRYYPSDYPEVESLLLLKRARFRHREVSVAMVPRKWGTSSITPTRAMIYMLIVPFAMFLEFFKKNPYRKTPHG